VPEQLGSEHGSGVEFLCQTSHASDIRSQPKIGLFVATSSDLMALDQNFRDSHRRAEELRQSVETVARCGLFMSNTGSD
jgi:hypothetical protein